THFGGSPKVPDALFELGNIELELNNIPKAKDYLTQVTVSYPASPAADLATEKLMQIRAMHP
ncbi:MAG: tol-pal system protein YbgF, partial [Methylococcales bacterium]|nr:tol-pal system protein YbgF [Methylococcales bacterium]